MELTAFVFILISALFHSLWNIILKTSERKIYFNVLMHLSAIGIFSLFFIIREGGIPLPSVRLALLTVVTGFFFSIYHFCLTASYESTDVSLAYPLTTTGPLYIPLWAFIFLGERLSLAGVLGIFLVVSGTYVIQMKKISMKGIFEPLRNLKDPGVILALGAGFFYSIGAVLDKKTVSGHDVFTYTYYLDIVLVTFLIIGNLLSREMRSGYSHELREHWPKILLAGGVLFCSFLTYRLGLKMAKVSYAASARQVSALFGVFFGIFLFRESSGRIRITGALFITLGIILIKFG